MSDGATSGDDLLDELQRTIGYIVDVDLPTLDEEVRDTLVGHLTGAVIVVVLKNDEERE